MPLKIASKARKIKQIDPRHSSKKKFLFLFSPIRKLKPSGLYFINLHCLLGEQTALPIASSIRHRLARRPLSVILHPEHVSRLGRADPFCTVHTQCPFCAVHTQCPFCTVPTQCPFCTVHTQCPFCTVHTQCYDSTIPREPPDCNGSVQGLYPLFLTPQTSHRFPPSHPPLDWFSWNAKRLQLKRPGSSFSISRSHGVNWEWRKTGRKKRGQFVCVCFASGAFGGKMRWWPSISVRRRGWIKFEDLGITTTWHMSRKKIHPLPNPVLL